MHPEIKKEHPGLCPECGMNLIPVETEPSHQEHGNQDKHQGHSTNIFKMKFWVSFILSIPTVMYSSITQTLLDWQAPVFPGSEFIPFVLGSIVFFYGGWIFIASAFRELRARLPGMMTLISLAISTAYFYSVFVVLSGKGQDLFWELTTLIVVMLLGHWIEMRAVSGAQSALKELSKLLPDKAEVIRGNKTEVVSIEEIKEGDLVLIKPGGKIPTDGVVAEGNSDVNESLATGESKPVIKKIASEVIAGTINGDGSLKVKVTKIGEKTFLAGVMRLVAEAQSSKSRLQLLSDRAAFYLTTIAVVTGGVTFASWLAASSPDYAIERMVAVLVIACPHALGLAIPLVASISTTKAAKNGLLIKQRMALEAARKIDIVLFDKTGTLTKGEFGVDTIVPSPGINEETVLNLAASVNSHSEHPIGKAIVRSAKNKKITLKSVEKFERIAGLGAQGEVDGQKVYVGSPSLLEELKVEIESSLKPKLEELSGQGKTVIHVVVGTKLAGSIALSDIIREESREAITRLKQAGIKSAMITGDSDDVAKWVAEELGIDIYFARVLPEDKAKIVKQLQEGEFRNSKLEIRNSSRRLAVAMVGDGINDAPALTQADLGIAIGAGTNVAIESAGIILVKSDPRDIAKIMRLSKMTYNKMIQNLFWAAGYNVVAIPLAAGVLAWKGIILQPAVAAVFMSLSTIIVAFNAVLLKRRSLS
ncbi:MAG: heavy metal translocating P-type ATPase [Candidatus Doudnabacteria bacterium]|nr:heavy metal translocating P-type ATPase [Candidatus Doudnabacteria bacterium]